MATGAPGSLVGIGVPRPQRRRGIWDATGAQTALVTGDSGQLKGGHMRVIALPETVLWIRDRGACSSSGR